jgi:hypothetical protein
MAQTTGAMSWEDCKVEFATSSGSYSDISGSTNKVTTTGGDISKVEAYTHGTLTPLVAYGAAAAREIEIGVVYTETTGEAFQVAESAYTNKSDVWIRVTPAGSGKAFTTSVGRILSPPQISGEAGKPDFVMTTFKVACSTITWA